MEIKFVNKTPRDVDINQLDIYGAEMMYHTLKPDKCVVIDTHTFTRYAWIFRDSKTREKLIVKTEFYFSTLQSHYKIRVLSQSKMSVLNSPELMFPDKIVGMITLPVYSLKDRCFQVVRDNLDIFCNLDRLEELELQLPKTLVDELMTKWLKCK